MARVKSAFVCRNCGARASKWAGRCAECQEWDSFVEEVDEPSTSLAPRASVERPKRIDDIESAGMQRLVTGIAELDRVLGGGIVPGSAVLVGGDPGIGKSTLLLQAADAIQKRGARVLYVTGEESLQQTKLRAERIGVGSGEVFLLAETNASAIVDAARELRPAALVVDSIQTLYRDDLSSAPGSVSQVRECGAALVRFAKESGTAVFLVGHVTKEGVIAGPRVLEHLVDTVLQFEGDRHQSFRILRAAKNRFGATHEIGVFAMRDSGLAEVENPSLLFLGEDRGGAPGAAVAALIEGTRALLVEVQALVAEAPGRPPARRVTGVDSDRVALVQAALEVRAGVRVGARDVFVNLVGGVVVDEPAVDLAVALALAGALTGRALPAGTAVFGEVGLRGEVRAVTRASERLAEAARLGFKRVLAPRGVEPAKSGANVAVVETLADALRFLAPVGAAPDGSRSRAGS
ncbi:MAG: DNA repair protein RadA [Planctomycetes bacterium]|nr:DNA repair protein RadA [Planctomycetota bacterium]